MSVRCGIAAVAVVTAGCAPGEPPPAPGTPDEPAERTPQAAEPSMTREVPDDQRRVLGELSAEQLCDLVTSEDLRQLAFSVDSGIPRELGFDPPARGCSYPAESGSDTILIAAQPSGYGRLGREEIALGTTPGSETLHVNDCSVFAEVAGATLQVTVTTPEAGSEHCDMAESISQYVLPTLRK